MLRIVLSFAGTLALAYAALCLFVFLSQARLVYFPGPPPGIDPASVGLDFRELRFRAADGVELHGWLLQAPSARGAILFCHGNAGSIEHRLEAGSALVAMGFSVLLFDYRGYGASQGEPSEEGTYLDATAAYEQLLAQGFAPGAIVVHGESLGAGVALELATQREVAAVVAESAFTSVPDLGARIYPWLPVRLLARHRYENRAKVGKLGVPLLLIHSPMDEIVPFDHARTLLEAARDPKELLVTEAGHNDGGFLRRAEWRAAVQRFLERAVP